MRNKTEEILCRTFLDLLRKQPFSKITIQRIAGSCNVNRQTFYYHFDNIYDLMGKAFLDYYERDALRSRDWPMERRLSVFFQWMADNRGMLRNLCGSAERETIRKVLRPLVDLTVYKGGQQPLKSAVEAEYQEEFDQHFLVGAVTQYALEWVDSDFKEMPERMAGRLYRFMERLGSRQDADGQQVKGVLKQME